MERVKELTCLDEQGFQLKYKRHRKNLTLSLWDQQGHELLNDSRQVEIHPQSIHYTRDGKLWRIMDRMGNDIFQRGYKQGNTPLLMGEDRYVYSKDAYFGLKDLKGREIIPCRFDQVNDWDEHFIVFTKDEKHSALNRFGDEIISYGFDNIHILGEGLFQVEKEGKNALYMMEEGFLTPFDDYNFTHFFEGIAGYRLGHSEWGLIDATGKKVSVPELEHLDYLEEGIFVFCFEESRWGVLDDHQHILFPPLYNWIDSLGSGFLVLSKHGRCSLADVRGKEILPFCFNKIQSQDHRSFLCRDSKGYLFFDDDGDPMFMEHFPYATPFNQGTARVIYHGDNCLMNEKGQLLDLGDRPDFPKIHRK